jgi:hypothetical protein
MFKFAKVLVSLLFGVGVLAGSASHEPQPPCGSDPTPAYSDLGKPPSVGFWDRSDPTRAWTPPECTGWTIRGFSTLTAIAGRFRSTRGAAALRTRIGAISEMKGTRYWSTTHKDWRTLIDDAFATNSPTPVKRRMDFSADEIREGASVYFQQTDNLSGKAIYRMHILQSTPDRLVFETENVTTMRYLLYPLFHPGDLQAIYFLDRESSDVWRYFSMVRTGSNASGLSSGHEASSINRAVAYYRFVAGIPSDLEPPAQR